MLRNYYAPTDFSSVDCDPNLSVEAKLSVIEASPVIVKPGAINSESYVDSYSLSLPFVVGAKFYVGLNNDSSFVHTNYFNIGDKELYGRRIGSRILRAALRYAVELNPSVETFSTGRARLGLVNTAVRVLGEENVAVRYFGDRFGWQSDRKLDEVLDEYPPTIGEKYIVKGIEAKIDRDQAVTWELPVPVLN